MQIDLDWTKNKMKMTDGTRAVAYITQTDSVESELALGQFLTDVPIEKTIQDKEAEIVRRNIRMTKHKEWEARVAKKKTEIDTLSAEFTLAETASQATGATDLIREDTLRVKTAIDELYKTMLGGPVGEDGVMDTSVMAAIVDSWEGGPEEKEYVTDLKSDLRDLKKDRNIHDKGFGTMFKFLKDTTGVELHDMILHEGTLRDAAGNLRGKSVIYKEIRRRLLEMLKGDPTATRAHLRSVMTSLPKVRTLKGLLTTVQSLKRIRILLQSHLLLYPNEEEVVQDGDFKRALKTCFAAGNSEINTIQITIAQFTGSASWEDMKLRVYEMINNDLDALADSKAKESFDAPVGDRKAFVLDFADLHRGGASSSSSSNDRGGQSPARRGQSPGRVPGQCYDGEMPTGRHMPLCPWNERQSLCTWNQAWQRVSRRWRSWQYPKKYSQDRKKMRDSRRRHTAIKKQRGAIQIWKLCV